MPIDFPSSPTVGQVYTYNGITYTYTTQGTWSSASVGSGFSPGTLMIFQQTAAPTGWTKQTVHNDKALRVTSGAAGTGGSVAFSTLFGRTSVDDFTLTANEMPTHGHGTSDPTHVHNTAYSYVTLDYYQFGVGNQDAYHWGAASAVAGNYTGVGVAANGSGAAHSHGMDMRVMYVDVISASKD